MGSTWSRLKDLPLVVESYALEGLRRDVSSGFTRHTTVIALHGAGEIGEGEDVTYGEEDQLAFQAHGGSQPLAGRFTLESFSAHLDDLALFPEKPEHAASVDYRRWAFESAALDLALRQAGTSLARRLERTLQPLRFVVSLRLDDDDPTVEPIRKRLELYPWMRFKLDPTSSWSDDLLGELARLDVVDVVDFKGHYEGTVVDQEADPELYRRVIEALPDAFIEDPHIDDRTAPILEPYTDRITWDAPIHSVADIEAREVLPKVVNVKPSRFGPLRRLFDAFDFCADRGIGMYGGGQFELGPGRGHIQYLAAMFHPDSCNDVAPDGFHAADPTPGLPGSPLAVAAHETGFRRG